MAKKPTKATPKRAPKIVVIGGTGFVGSHIVKALAKEGYLIHVVARDAVAGAHLKPYGDVGQISVTSGNVLEPDSIRPALKGAQAVIYLPGLLFETASQHFSEIHAHAPAQIAHISKEEGVTQFIFMSALGVDNASKSAYARTKYEGEKKVREARTDATILRPSVIFGADDNFINQFARMAILSPFLPLIGGGKTKFQPVFVGDIASAITHIVYNTTSAGITYELCGPETLTFKEILQMILRESGLRAYLLPIPFFVAKIIGTLANIFCPTPPLTGDQITLLTYDNVANSYAKSFKQLGIIPRSLAAELPFIVRRYRALTPLSDTSKLEAISDVAV